MSSTPYISHAVNGYSRYDIPESIAFSASAGILYPVRCDFMNARDVRYIQVGSMIRTNPALVPTFTPFRVSLHRFFVPLQLYHPEMRVNSARFDMQTMSTNCVPNMVRYTSLPSAPTDEPETYENLRSFTGRSLYNFLGLSAGVRYWASTSGSEGEDPFGVWPTAVSVKLGNDYVNGDPILAYYDIIRSYYAFSQTNRISLAFPLSSDLLNLPYGLPIPASGPGNATVTDVKSFLNLSPDSDYYRQVICRLDAFDQLYESLFYPKRNESAGLYYNRLPFICEAITQSFTGSFTGRYDDDDISRAWHNTTQTFNLNNLSEVSGVSGGLGRISLKYIWPGILPYGVAPAIADRFSRLLPSSGSEDVSLSNITTVRGLAFASKLQAYKDLLSSGGSRFSDWLQTFFAAKIPHVDRPLLLYSSSYYLNSSPIFSQQGGETLGSYAGVIEGKEAFGKRTQRYCFDEPGYLIDIFCIRPLYYWSGLQKDYARYDKLDYFNPIFNEVGYETLPGVALGINYSSSQSMSGIVKQPCYNEYRASYDRVLGDLALMPGYQYKSFPLLSSWVQQRANYSAVGTQGGSTPISDYLETIYFTDVSQSNSVFASRSEDNFFVNLYYNVTSKTLVSKNFATNLATR